MGGPERTPGYYQSEEEGSDTGLNEESAEGFAALYQIHWSSHEGRSLTPLWNFWVPASHNCNAAQENKICNSLIRELHLWKTEYPTAWLTYPYAVWICRRFTDRMDALLVESYTSYLYHQAKTEVLGTEYWNGPEYQSNHQHHHKVAWILWQGIVLLRIGPTSFLALAPIYLHTSPQVLETLQVCPRYRNYESRDVAWGTVGSLTRRPKQDQVGRYWDPTTGPR